MCGLALLLAVVTVTAGAKEEVRVEITSARSSSARVTTAHKYDAQVHRLSARFANALLGGGARTCAVRLGDSLD